MWWVRMEVMADGVGGRLVACVGLVWRGTALKESVSFLVLVSLVDRD